MEKHVVAEEITTKQVTITDAAGKKRMSLSIQNGEPVITFMDGAENPACLISARTTEKEVAEIKISHPENPHGTTFYVHSATKGKGIVRASRSQR